MTAAQASSLAVQLEKLPAFCDPLGALRELAGIDIRLAPVTQWPPHKRGEDCLNPFCRLMVKAGRDCAACQRAEREVASHKVAAPQSVTCLGGLCQTAVPVRLDDEIFAVLEIGPLLLEEPGEEQFRQTLALLRRLKTAPDERVLYASLFERPVVPADRHEALVRVLVVFAEHASLLAQQLCLAGADGEPRAVAIGRKFIARHQSEPITLGDVASAANVSTSYFSRMFKKVTARTFTDYLARLRIEQARQLLRNPEMRVGEVAYAVGFQSIPHFNRVFKGLTGESPTQWRARVQNMQSKNA